VGRKRGENLVLLRLGHVEKVERSPKLGRDLVEFGRRDLQFAMRLFQAEGSIARLGIRRPLPNPLAGSVPPPGRSPFLEYAVLANDGALDF
jgi:hypothetical protein